MAKYKNKRTGAIIDIPGVVTGDVWEKVVKVTEPKAETATEEVPTEAKTEEKTKPTKTALKRSKRK